MWAIRVFRPKPTSYVGLSKIRRFLTTQGDQWEVDVIFDEFAEENKEFMSVDKFSAAMKQKGLKKTDPRLANFVENLRILHGSKVEDTLFTQKLTREEFKVAVEPILPLMYRFFKNDLIVPDFVAFTKYLGEWYEMCRNNNEGKVANYIPQLGKMSPNYWGVSVCTVDGQRFSIGDTMVPFTLQSTTKPITYGIALDRLSQEVVHQYIGQEPSGRNFNEIVLDHNKKPHNPMVNAGAIIVCSLLKGLVYPEMTLGETFGLTMEYFKRMAGGESIGYNNSVFLSERQAANRNYALGFYMRENRCFPENTNFKEVMDLYFQCCSIEANCEAVAVIAATLANGGFCPLTEDRVLKSDSIRDVLSLMHSCGMYDYSGKFAFKVGLPAKSGVSGALMVVIPNVMGICTWSPPLDQLGNSARGIQFCESAGRQLALLMTHQSIGENLKTILLKNPQMSQPELVREFDIHDFNRVDRGRKIKTPRGLNDKQSENFSVVNLLFCAAQGDIEGLRMHWLSGTDLGKKDFDSRTALHLAAAEGHLDCVQLLLQLGKVPYDVADRWGNTPLSEAQSNNRVQVVEFISKWSATANDSKRRNNPAEDLVKDKPKKDT